MTPARSLAEALLASASAAGLRVEAVGGLERLTGGASRESWAFRLEGADAADLVARVAPATARFASAGTVSLATEARLIDHAARAGVPVPRLAFDLGGGDYDGYAMERLYGESVGARILKSEALAPVRPILAGQCGKFLAAIHAIPLDGLPPLDVQTPMGGVDALEARYRATGQDRPVFDLAIAWLREKLTATAAPALLHGDFRNGNLMVDARGICGILDWETSHIGDPAEDLGWLCVASWRFQRPEFPVGGFGTREDLLEAYARAGGAPISPAQLKAWEVFGTLRWGVMCAEVGARFAAGVRSVEGGMIARRASETEFDLLELIGKD